MTLTILAQVSEVIYVADDAVVEFPQMGSSGPATMRRNVATIREAREQVQAHLIAGWRGLTAEVVDAHGEVVAYYDRGWTTS